MSVARLLRASAFHRVDEHKPGVYFAACGAFIGERRTALYFDRSAAAVATCGHPACSAAAVDDDAAPESGERLRPPPPVIPRLKPSRVVAAAVRS